MDAIKYCRMCITTLNGNTSSIYIFAKQEKNLDIHQVILDHFGFHISENDGFSQIVCEECYFKTVEFHNFYTKIQLAQRDLNSTKNAHLKTEQLPIDLVKTEVGNDKEEYLDTESILKTELDLITDQHPSEPNVSIQNENEQCDSDWQEDNDVVDEVDKGDDDDDEDDSDDEYLNFKKKGKRKKYAKKAKSDVTKKSDEEKAFKQKLYEEREKQITEFFKMSCEICDTIFESFLSAKKHYRTKHRRSGFLVCCGKRFFRRGRILDHINRHLNPIAFKCAKCDKIFSDKDALKSHLKGHEPIQSKPYKCKVCNSSFNLAYKLNQHTRLRHSTDEDKKFRCEQCGKAFITKSILASHVRGVHDFAYAQVCDICAKVFKSKQVFEMHRLVHMDVEQPKLQCTICGRWLKHENSLRAHMSRHNDTSQVCTICNKVTPNKHALGNHMRYVHSERVHQCTMCDKAFKKPIGLKEHMAAHTGVDLYKCPHCPKTFKSNANMHSHRKKSHPEEWQKNRGQKMRKSADTIDKYLP